MGIFPSAAIAWRIKNEKFLIDKTWLDDLKLRVSYGVSGNNAVGAYSTLLGVANTQYDLVG